MCVFEEVRSALMDYLAIPENLITEDTDFRTDIHLTQADLHGAAETLEKKYGIRFTEEEIGSLKKVGDLVRRTEQHLMK